MGECMAADRTGCDVGCVFKNRHNPPVLKRRHSEGHGAFNCLNRSVGDDDGMDVMDSQRCSKKSNRRRGELTG